MTRYIVTAHSPGSALHSDPADWTVCSTHEEAEFVRRGRGGVGMNFLLFAFSFAGAMLLLAWETIDRLKEDDGADDS
jgi:hypothetical protein